MSFRNPNPPYIRVAMTNATPLEHARRPFVVHEIAHDFDLEDLWTFDLGDRRAASVEEFLPVFWDGMRGMEDSILTKIRIWVGARLGWDEGQLTLSIPGCEETSVAARLRAPHLVDNRDHGISPVPSSAPKVKTIYVFEKEALYELSNGTIHALVHVATLGRQATLAVYVKHRGLASRLYMAAIWPARHLLLYPALVRRIERGWFGREPAVTEPGPRTA